jgi:hypothetical protein
MSQTVCSRKKRGQAHDGLGGRGGAVAVFATTRRARGVLCSARGISRGGRGIDDYAKWNGPVGKPRPRVVGDLGLNYTCDVDSKSVRQGMRAPVDRGPHLVRAKRRLHPHLGQVVVLLRDRETLEQQLHLPVVRVVADPRRPVVREHLDVVADEEPTQERVGLGLVRRPCKPSAGLGSAPRPRGAELDGR